MSKIIQQLAASKERKNIINVKATKSAPEAKVTLKVGQTRAQEEKKRKLANSSSSTPAAAKESKVIYLGHIPNGFFEAELRKFFSQFGLVKRIKLFRSEKTGGSKGYAFIEFDSADTAKIVAEAMNGYYVMERQFVSHVIPLSKQHEGMFKANKKRKSAEKDDEESEAENDKKLVAELTQEQFNANAEVIRTSLRKKQKKLSDLGIDFEITIPV